MSAMSFDQILHAAEDLSAAERQALIQHLQKQVEQPGLSAGDKLALLRAVQVHVQVNQEPSLRREDWYGDDGR